LTRYLEVFEKHTSASHDRVGVQYLLKHAAAENEKLPVEILTGTVLVRKQWVFEFYSN
jgi:hypothetical protein